MTSDNLWKLDAYRVSLFLLHLSQGDAKAMRAAQRTEAVAEQLVRAVGPVSANLAEGYSRSTRADRIRFLAYSLGSARECLIWYQAARDALPEQVIGERLVLVARIRSVILGMIRSNRTSKATAHDLEPRPGPSRALR